ncbi:hypothetical protein DPMN_192030 [Dreissena polymorpha]|uniref:Uncharacterized protein n=1 Tax=Dreissena polymorpha TaxID=45954 RepID=A0A9D3Y273_DREPO|nr:hypothetical protein DPMN_192030 [Dreissena polymorpha]
MTSLVHEIRRDTPVGTTVLNVVTHDLDNDEVNIFMISHNKEFILKKVSSLTASLTIASPLNLGLISIALLARDHGIPFRVTPINVSLTVTDDSSKTTHGFFLQSTTSPMETVSSNGSSTAPATVTSPESTTNTRPKSYETRPTTVSTNMPSSTSSTSHVTSSMTTDETTDGSTVSSSSNGESATTDPSNEHLSSSTTSSTEMAADILPTTSVSSTTSLASTTGDISTTTAERTATNFTSASKQSTNITSILSHQEDGVESWIVNTAIGSAVGAFFLLIVIVIVFVCVMKRRAARNYIP